MTSEKNISSDKYYSTQPSIPPGLVNQVLACLVGGTAGCVHLCRVEGNTV